MKTRNLRSVLVLAGLSIVFVVTGCSENPPCNTDPSQVDTARSALAEAEQKVDSAQADLDQARQTKSSLENKMDSLPDTADLEDRLEELKKGSGR